MQTRGRLGTAFAAACVALAAPALGACVVDTGTPATKTVTATAPTSTATTSQRDALLAWRDATRVPTQELKDAMGKISTAADVEDLITMGIACQEAHDAVGDYQQHMPSPDPQLTAALQKALSDYDAAARICTTAVENRNIDDFKQGGALIREGNTYMEDALNVLQVDLGESSSAEAQPSYSSPVPSPLPPPPDPVSQLSEIANGDRPFVSTWLVGYWVPQLSSKHLGSFDDGKSWDNASILQEHSSLRQRYGAKLLWSGDWPRTFKLSDYWVTVAPLKFSEPSDATNWCRNQGFDTDHCLATQLQ